MKITKGKIILVIVVAYFGVMTFVNNNKTKSIANDIMSEVTIVKDGKINKKNEGKLVLVTGKISYDGTISFNELDTEINSIKVYRKVEDYVNYTTPSGTKTHRWEERKEAKDENSDNILDTLYTDTKTLDTQVGEFKLDEIGMSKVETETYYKETLKIGDKLEFSNLFYEDLEHVETPVLGDVRLNYKYFDNSKIKYLTVLAEQSNDTFKPYSIDGTEVYYVYNGKINTKSLLQEQLKENIKSNNRGRIVFIIIIIAAGIFFIVDAKKKD